MAYVHLMHHDTTFFCIFGNLICFHKFKYYKLLTTFPLELYELIVMYFAYLKYKKKKEKMRYF